MSTEPEARTRQSSLREHAVVVDPWDNVAVLKKGVSGGAILSVPERPGLRVASAVSAGNRIALEAILSGEHVMQYGQPIGTSRGIPRGAPITVDNMDDEVPVVRELPTRQGRSVAEVSLMPTRINAVSRSSSSV